MIKKLYTKLIRYIYLNPLERLNNKLLIDSDSKNKFYEKHIRWQLSNAIIYLLHEESEWSKAFGLLKDSKILILLAILVASTLCFTYYMGSQSRETEITSINASDDYKSEVISSLSSIIYYNKSVIHSKQDKIDQLNSFKQSREWLEYKIYLETEMDKFHLKMGRIDDDILLLMSDQANKYEIPYSIYFRLIDTESKYKFIANRKSGAFGYMQIMPRTFRAYSKKLGLKGGHNKKNDVLVGSYMLYIVHEQWMERGKDKHVAWEYTLAEYNAGRGKMQIKKNGKVVGYRIPSYTRKYIKTIMKTYNRKYRN